MRLATLGELVRHRVRRGATRWVMSMPRPARRRPSPGVLRGDLGSCVLTAQPRMCPGVCRRLLGEFVSTTVESPCREPGLDIRDAIDDAPFTKANPFRSSRRGTPALRSAVRDQIPFEKTIFVDVFARGRRGKRP
jgi:hypothetical protein